MVYNVFIRKILYEMKRLEDQPRNALAIFASIYNLVKRKANHWLVVDEIKKRRK